MRSAPRVFSVSAATIAVAFSLAVALLLLADLVYVVIEFAASAAPERSSEVVREVLSSETRREVVLSLVTATITTGIALAVAIPGLRAEPLPTSRARSSSTPWWMRRSCCRP